MFDILLAVVNGGMGRMQVAVIGAPLFGLAKNYSQDLHKLGALAADGVPLLGPVFGPLMGPLVSPGRWLLWLGLLLVLSVYHFPTAVVGRLRALAMRQRG